MHEELAHDISVLEIDRLPEFFPYFDKFGVLTDYDCRAKWRVAFVAVDEEKLVARHLRDLEDAVLCFEDTAVGADFGDLFWNDDVDAGAFLAVDCDDVGFSSDAVDDQDSQR